MVDKILDSDSFYLEVGRSFPNFRLERIFIGEGNVATLDTVGDTFCFFVPDELSLTRVQENLIKNIIPLFESGGLRMFVGPIIPLSNETHMVKAVNLSYSDKHTRALVFTPRPNQEVNDEA